MNTRKSKTPGTIDRPLTHAPDPKNQAPMTPSLSDLTARTSDAHASRQNQNRNLQMQLMPEALARAQMQQRLREAEHERRSLHVMRADRLQRRAERVARRARRALAMAVMQ